MVKALIGTDMLSTARSELRMVKGSGKVEKQMHHPWVCRWKDRLSKW